MSKTPMDIYVVTRGEYSDYSVRAVFSDRTDAEDWIEKKYKVAHFLRHGKDICMEKTDDSCSYPAFQDPYMIETFTMDAYTGEVVRTCWTAEIRERFLGVNTPSEWIIDRINESREVADPNARSRMPNQEESERFTVLVTSYVSRDHAQKLAAEWIQKKRASQINEGVDGD